MSMPWSAEEPVYGGGVLHDDLGVPTCVSDMTVPIRTDARRAIESDRCRFGPLIEPGGVRFRLWAPGQRQVSLVLDGKSSATMTKTDGGFFEVLVENAAPGDRYNFRIGDAAFPDPASRQQHGGTHGWSIVRRPFEPSARKGPLRPWHETVICEVHVGTVTPEGTFEALRDRLEHFRDAGYTCLELMPVAAFPGSRNWGYDGTLLFAPAEAYGAPDELRSLVDRAHELGLCVVLDVVYNHFGEVDNFVQDYAPEWFDEEVETPWGPGINFNQPMVRQFYYENAAMWLAEYDFDGLRFDSIHEMKSASRDLFLGELAKHARAAKHHAKLIAENMDNTATWLERRQEFNEPVNFVSQWNDDIHHVLHFLVTGEGRVTGYDDPSKDPYADLEKALVDGLVHDGEADGESDGRTRGEPASRLPPDSFITYVQNHDQIGNRADARRLPDRISADKLDFLHFLAFLAPQIPLFFMGEEAHLRTRFPFFIDLPEEQAAVKRADRYEQMRDTFHEDVADGDLPDPNDPATFESAKLEWAEYCVQERRSALERFRTMAGMRRDIVWPLTATPCLDATGARQGNAFVINWIFEGGTLTMALNPNDAPTDIGCSILNSPVSTGSWCQHGEVLRLGPWSAVVWAMPRG
jgi:maltooligosyltrehalose trehalohydrolase